MQHVLRMLQDIAVHHGISMGIGGSYLLKAHDFDVDVHDLDLMVPLSQFKSLVLILEPYQTNHNREVFSSGFATFQIDGIDVDVMAEMHLPFNHKTPFIACYENDEPGVAYMTLESWYIIYRCLGRHEKANMIQDSFEKKEYNGDIFYDLIGFHSIQAVDLYIKGNYGIKW